MIAGPNGAGKTTFAKNYLLQETDIVTFMNADLIAAGLSPLKPELANRAAGRLLLEELDKQVASRESFALESTLSGKTYLDRLQRMKEEGYRIEIIFLKLESAELAIKRVTHRVKQGGHAVPAEDVRRRFDRGWCNFVERYRPLANVWVVYDNSGRTPSAFESKP